MKHVLTLIQLINQYLWCSWKCSLPCPTSVWLWGIKIKGIYMIHEMIYISFHVYIYDTIWYYIWIWCCLPCPTSVWRSAFYLHTSPSPLRGAGLFCKVDIRINSATYEGITWNATLWKGSDISMQSVHVMLVLSAQGCISCGPCSCPELTEDHVLPSA